MKPKHHSLGINPLKPHWKLFSSYWWKDVFNPKKYYRFVKYFIQRGYRGYADCDYWDMDGYLEDVMIGLFSSFKHKTHSYPDGLTPEQWEEIIKEIIEGLEASQELTNETTVPKEVYPRRISYSNIEEFLEQVNGESDEPSFDVKLYEKWAAPLSAKRLRAAKLIVKYWPNFWD